MSGNGERTDRHSGVTYFPAAIVEMQAKLPDRGEGRGDHEVRSTWLPGF
jgi:hypothetical protein